MFFKTKYLYIIFPLVIFITALIVFASEADFLALKEDANPSIYEGKIIKKINVIGAPAMNPEEVLDYFNVKEGEKFDSGKINTAIKKMFQNDVFERVAVDIDQEGADLILNLVVSLKPLVERIYFLGNKRIASDSLRETIKPHLKENSPYSPQKLTEAVNAVISNYQSKGYLKIYVSPKIIENRETGAVTIDMNIEEGQEIQIASINFHGNTKFSASTLQRQMQTKERGFLKLGKFDENKFAIDTEKITIYYRDRGYYYAKITDVRYRYQWKDPAKKDVQNLFIDIYINEGNQYDFGLIDVKGNIIIPTADIFKNFKSKKGSVYNYSYFYTDYSRIQSEYSDRGYLFRQVIPIVNVNEDTKTINITYDIIENDKAHIENVIVSGNTKTKEYVIRRYIDIKRGELFNSAKIRRVQEQLLNTQFFNNATIGMKPGSAEGLMNLVFNIEEGKTAVISGGGGFSTSTGFKIFAEIKEMNFLGRGQQIGLRGELGQDLKLVSINFADPYIFKSPFYFGAEFTYFHENVNTGIQTGQNNFGFPKYSYYTRQGIEFLVRLGYYFLDNFSTYLSFRNLWVQYIQTSSQGATPNTPVNVSPDIANELSKNHYKNGKFKWLYSAWNPTYVLSYTLAHDSRDNYMNPRRGWYGRYNVDFYFGYTELSKQSLIGFKAFPTFWKTSVVLYGEFGQILSGMSGRIRNEGDVLYYLNPFEDVRGWQGDLYTKFKLNRGYTTYLLSDGGRTSYGRTKIRFFAEFRIPITQKSLSATVFLDAGHLWMPKPSGTSSINGMTFENYPSQIISMKALFDPAQYIYSVGFGLRVTVPVINIRLYGAKRFVYNDRNVGFGKGLRDFEGDSHSVFGSWLGRGWEIVFSMNHPFY